MRKLLLLITLLLSSCSGNIPSSDNWVLNFKIKINDACILENGSLYCVAYDKDAYGKILETHEYTYPLGYYVIDSGGYDYKCLLEFVSGSKKFAIANTGYSIIKVS